MKYLILALLLIGSAIAQNPTLANSDDIIAAKARANHTGTQPASTISDASASGLAVLTGTPAQGLAALGANKSISGAWYDDLDAENFGVAIGELYKVDGGTIAWRDSSFALSSLTPVFHWAADASDACLDSGGAQASDAEAVSTLVDAGSGLTNAALSGTAATYEASGPNSKSWLKTAASSPGQYVTSAFGQFPAKRGTWFVVYRPDTLVAGQKRVLGSYSGGSGTTWAAYNPGPGGYPLYAGAFPTVPTLYQWDLAGDVVVLGLRRESDTQWTLWRGSQKHFTFTLADHTATDNPLRIGQELIGRLGEVVGFSTALSDADMQKVGGYLSGKWTASYPINLAFEGDSQTAGAGVVTGGSNLTENLTWPAKVVANMGGASRLSYRNVAVGGSIFSTLETRAAALDAHVSTHALNVLTVWCGTNETTVPGNAATTHASLKSYCEARRAAGWDKIVVVTAMARGDQPNETWRGAYNTLIRDNYADYADGLIDVAANANLGTEFAYNDATYFNVDTIHINATGCTVMASLAEPVLEAVTSGF